MTTTMATTNDNDDDKLLIRLREHRGTAKKAIILPGEHTATPAEEEKGATEKYGDAFLLKFREGNRR